MGHKNLTSRMIAFSLVLMLILSCRLPGMPRAAEPVEEAAATAAVTATVPDEVLAAPTDPPTVPDVPTDTAVPTSTPTRAPELDFAVIDPANAAQLAEVARFGKGYIKSLSWISGSTDLLVSSSSGIHRYDSQGNEELWFFEKDQFYNERAFFSPDGSLLAAVPDEYTFDPAIRLWDLETFQLLNVFEGHTQPIQWVAFSPDGMTLATASTDVLIDWTPTGGTIRLWDIHSGEQLRILMDDLVGVRQLSFSPDGTVLAAQGLNNVFLWDVASGALLNQIEEESLMIRNMRLTPDGVLVAMWDMDEKSMILSETMTGAQISTLKGFSSHVNCAAFSTDGSQLVTASYDRTVHLWDVYSGELLSTQEIDYYVDWVEFSPDGEWVSMGPLGQGRQITFWNISTNSLHRRLTQHRPSGRSVAFSPDGLHLVSAGFSNKTRVWDLFTGGLYRELKGYYENSGNAAFTPDGLLLTTGSSGSQRKPVSIYSWDVNTGYAYNGGTHFSDNIKTLAYSPDGSMLATVGSYPTYGLNLWYIRTGRHLIELEGHEDTMQDSVEKLAFSPDGTKLVSGDRLGIIHLWDPISGSKLNTFEGHEGRMISLAFSPDGSMLVSASEFRIYFWDVGSGVLLKELDLEGSAYQSVLRFSPTGDMLAFGSHSIRLWDVSSGHLLTWIRETSNVLSLDFSPCGRLLVTGGADGIVRLWGVPQE